MGVTTLLRNDITVTAAATPMSMVSTEIAEEDITSSDGRLLLLCTKPPGARGPVWHLNVYRRSAENGANRWSHPRRASINCCGHRQRRRA
eukprot:1798177-Rhodomonas_salina.1